MKLVGSVTFTVTKDEKSTDKQVSVEKNIGEATGDEARIAVFQFASQLANDVPAFAIPRALSVTVEA